MKPIFFARHRFPPDVIRHAFWLYLRFTLSYRDVEDLLAERGLTVSNESIRRWVLKFGPVIAKNLRRSRPKPHSRWHLDEMAISIAGPQMYMWRAVDSEGEVLEILVQPQRDKAAAVRLPRKLLRRQGFVPTVIVTDKLRSYGAALRELGSWVCMSKDCAPTIARRIRISRFDDANVKCKASNRPTQLSALFPSTRPFTTRSTCNGI
jgi:transposase-like protein